ncbi:MAG: hypothetical protein VKJ06_00010 [Vampirovibrionales bacterium]|nr:hypothetical protein [Vampirovibrionales bacterium]
MTVQSLKQGAPGALEQFQRFSSATMQQLNKWMPNDGDVISISQNDPTGQGPFNLALQEVIDGNSGLGKSSYIFSQKFVSTVSGQQEIIQISGYINSKGQISNAIFGKLNNFNQQHIADPQSLIPNIEAKINAAMQTPVDSKEMIEASKKLPNKLPELNEDALLP